MFTLNRTVKYYQVTAIQLFVASLLTGIIAAALVVINIQLKEYLQLPIVISTDDGCVSVNNYNNGEAFTCEDVDVILRNYRIQTYVEPDSNTDVPVHDMPEGQE